MLMSNAGERLRRARAVANFVRPHTQRTKERVPMQTRSLSQWLLVFNFI